MPHFESEMLGDFLGSYLQAHVSLEAHSFAFPTSHIASPNCSPALFSAVSSAILRRCDGGLIGRLLDENSDVKKGKNDDSFEDQLNELTRAVILKLVGASVLPGGPVKTQIVGPPSQSF